MTMKAEAQRLDTLAANVMSLRDKKTQLEDALHDLNARIREAEGELVSAMRDLGITSFRTGNLMFGRTTRLSVRKTDEAALFRWLHEHGWEGVIKETVHPRTLERVVRETLEADGQMPSGVEASEYDVLSVRKQ